MKLTCPHCRQPAHIRTSRPVTELTREAYVQCTNVYCGHTFYMVMSIVRTIVPSQTPSPTVFLPRAKRGDDPPDSRQLDLLTT